MIVDHLSSWQYTAARKVLERDAKRWRFCRHRGCTRQVLSDSLLCREHE